MRVIEITEAGVTRAWAKSQGSHGAKLKYRCQVGPRKGQVRSTPAACMAPINIEKSRTIKHTKKAKGGRIQVKTAKTKRTSPTSRRVARMNAGSRRKKI